MSFLGARGAVKKATFIFGFGPLRSRSFFVPLGKRFCPNLVSVTPRVTSFLYLDSFPVPGESDGHHQRRTDGPYFSQANLMEFLQIAA